MDRADGSDSSLFKIYILGKNPKPKNCNSSSKLPVMIYIELIIIVGFVFAVKEHVQETEVCFLILIVISLLYFFVFCKELVVNIICQDQ